MFTAADKRQIEEHGLSVENVTQQIALCRSGPRRLRLIRPCTAGDGIRVLADEDVASYGEHWVRERPAARAVKFVPASGAATRMFRLPQRWLLEKTPVSRRAVRELAAAGDKDAIELEELLDGFERLAVWEDLEQAMRRDGVDARAAANGDDVRIVLEYLLTPKGVGAAERPKALIPFHRYPDERRTPIQEHLVESTHMVRDAEGRCRVHFTVSKEHLEACRRHAREAAGRYAPRYGAHFDVDFSLQKPATDSIAVDPDGEPVRDSNGRLVLRPSGHGALLENLNDLDADVAFIKNIDNVVPDSRKDVGYRWRDALAGVLVSLVEEARQHEEAVLAEGGAALAGAWVFLRESLGIASSLPADAPVERRCEEVVGLLRRPVRVCAMVLNRGEAGGGPFWVERNGRISKQIVEAAEVDRSSPEQLRIFRSATHFNPVDLVCWLRDPHGRPLDLRRFVDEDAYLVVEKSHQGRPLRAIERPGLWNGSMADWNTVFVEIPLESFAPVKTINDLLRPEHQP